MNRAQQTQRADTSEGDTNLSQAREDWYHSALDDRGRRILEDDTRLFLRQALSTPCLDVLEHAQGSVLMNTRGHALLDFHGNSVHQVGHANPAVISAVRNQLDELAFCPRRFTNRRAVELAQRLSDLSPWRRAKVLYTPSGAGAVGIALKLARAVTGRFKTVSWWDSFHGASLDTISVGGEAMFRKGIGPLLPGALHVPPPGAVMNGHIVGCDESVDYLEYVMEHEQDIAAFIAEPIRCTTVTIPDPGYWDHVRDLCDRYGALLVFDEIPLCLGRTGRMLALEHFGVKPDIVCIGKGLGGGVFPMAAVLARPELDVAPASSLGHYTHEKSPVGAAAALAVLEYIESQGLLSRALEVGDRMMAGLRSIKHPAVTDVRGIGLLLGVELEPPGAGDGPSPAERVLYASLKRGLSFKVAKDRILTLMPPLTVTVEEQNRAVEILRESFGEL